MGLLAAIAGAVCLMLAVLRRHTEHPDVLLILVVGGLALMFAGTVTLGSGG